MDKTERHNASLVPRITNLGPKHFIWFAGNHLETLGPAEREDLHHTRRWDSRPLLPKCRNLPGPASGGLACL